MAWVLQLPTGERRVLRDGQYVLGRDPGCTVPVEDTSVSRQHAVLTIRGAQASIRDLGSSSGTAVGGQRLAAQSEAPIAGSTSVQLGQALLYLTYEAAVVAPQQPPGTYVAPPQPPGAAPAPYGPPPGAGGGPPVFYKNPAVAVVLSFFWAGLGQIYNGQIGKGVAFILAYGFAALLCFVLIGFLLAPVIWIWGMVDAYVSAGAVNRRLWEEQQRRY